MRRPGTSPRRVWYRVCKPWRRHGGTGNGCRRAPLTGHRGALAMPAVGTPHVPLRHEIFRIERVLKPESDRLPRRQHKIIAVMPAYNAEATLAATLADVPVGSIDEVLLVD